MIKTKGFIHNVRRRYCGNSKEYVLDSFRDCLEDIPEGATIDINIIYEIEDEPEAQK